MKQKVFLFIILFILSLDGAYSQPINKAKLDSLFNILNEKNKAMGSMAISLNGNIVYNRAIGYCDISNRKKIPSTSETRYRIGSISKMFTATMIMQLIEEGKLGLETKLNTYFPSIPNADKITINELLRHRSGIHNFTNDPDYLRMLAIPKTHDEILAIFYGNSPDFEPNEKASYSNTNYVLLGYIIEKTTNQSYQQNLNKRITSRIGLKNTYYGGKTDLKKNECFSYRYMNQWMKETETDMSIPGGAGAIVSTPSDMVKFIEALFSGKLISQNSLELMKTTNDGFGIGMFQIPFKTKIAYGHNGGIDGFGANLAYFPEEKMAIAYCTNGIVYPMNDILIGVLCICFNDDYKIPEFKTIVLKAEDLKEYLGTYSSPQNPIKITITQNNTTLIAQGTNQPSFPLEAIAQDTFQFEMAGIIMEFNVAKKELTLKQGGETLYFFKE